MDVDGANARKLADVDAGHGYAANWSPDGAKIAFVVRENPEDANADQSSSALRSNIYIVDVEGGDITKVTNFTEGYAETPIWSPDGNALSFNMVMDGAVNVFTVDIVTGDRLHEAESACCPTWMRK
jgi:Tol biopolymer transport system component